MTLSEVTTAISSEFTDFATAETAVKVAFRLCLAGILGGLLGYERESQGKAAGLRTHMLVAIGAALLVIGPIVSGADEASLSRIIQGLIAGIGFLGAGAIIKGNAPGEVHGLTTAATIWFTAAVGVTVGWGRATTAVVAALIALAVLQIIGRGERLLRLNQVPDEVDKPVAEKNSSDS
jgi:putative Mg2+ transporter-C (MgtC) family protein